MLFILKQEGDYMDRKIKNHLKDSGISVIVPQNTGAVQHSFSQPGDPSKQPISPSVFSLGSMNSALDNMSLKAGQE